MREIKFKAYWHKSKLITPVDTIEILDGGIHISDGCAHLGWLGKDCELLEYTGFKCNNEKVYEGYILKITLADDFADNFETMTDVGVVKMDGSGCWVVEVREDLIDLLHEWIDEDSEIIGNIFENPELLEGEKC